MRRRTTTQKLNAAITNNLLKVTRAECYYKTSRRTVSIDDDTFIENLQFLSEAGYFADCIGWTYEKDFKTNGYIVECSRTDGNSENIVTVYLCANDGVSDGDLERVLVIEESEEFAEKV